jgi:hypothetical protein
MLEILCTITLTLTVITLGITSEAHSTREASAGLTHRRANFRINLLT